ncbi:hypothetical protein BD626DRAFT_539329 [Schizophyllum amplum]|uniref:F-box domain-containing protein n=1 Tax=Schizophyllum amplum TaxID=97359 RepID=A0A550C4B7_9AGAR|nr:hypothetical protein BD626DRAFT_539329 [Auriculariopsis ampla]
MDALPVEIFDIVLSFLAKASNARVNLASAARVSRQWHNLTANYLWEHASLLAVLRLLPDDVWCFRERDENPFELGPFEPDHCHDEAVIPSVIKSAKSMRDLTNPVFVLLRDIEQSEWDGVMHLTSRVKNLYTFSSRLKALWVDDVILQRTEALSLFGSDHLRNIEFYPSRPMSPRTITPLLDATPTLVDTLEYLSIDTIDASILAKLRSLQNITINSAAPDIWDALSTLPVLGTVRMRDTYGKSGPLATTHSANAEAKTRFPRLEVLSIIFREDSSAHAVAMLEALSHKAQLQRLRISYSVFDNTSDMEDTMDIGPDITLLAAFSGLQAVQLDRVFNTAEVEMMARSWPLLEELELTKCPLTGLTALARRCSRLRRLRARVCNVVQERLADLERGRLYIKPGIVVDPINWGLSAEPVVNTEGACLPRTPSLVLPAVPRRSPSRPPTLVLDTPPNSALNTPLNPVWRTIAPQIRDELKLRKIRYSAIHAARVVSEDSGEDGKGLS